MIAKARTTPMIAKARTTAGQNITPSRSSGGVITNVIIRKDVSGLLYRSGAGEGEDSRVWVCRCRYATEM